MVGSHLDSFLVELLQLGFILFELNLHLLVLVAEQLVAVGEQVQFLHFDHQLVVLMRCDDRGLSALALHGQEISCFVELALKMRASLCQPLALELGLLTLGFGYLGLAALVTYHLAQIVDSLALACSTVRTLGRN